MSGSFQEALQDDQEWPVGPPEGPEVVGRPSRMSGNGQDAILDVREWSGGPLKCHGSVRKALPDVREDLSDVWE